jgi:hypothetical protein
MRQAGVEVAVSSWWGKDDSTDVALKNILAAQPQSSYPDLKWAIYYELEKGNPDSTKIFNDWSYVLSTLGSNPNYARVDGKPVIFVYGAPCSPPGVNRYADAKHMLNAAGYYPYISADIGPCWSDDYNDHTSLYTYDAVHFYPPGLLKGYKWCTSSATSDSPRGDTCNVSPGYWDAYRPYDFIAQNSYLPRDQVSYRDSLSGIAGNILGSSSAARWVTIVSWNEWHEGSQIEPGGEVYWYSDPTPYCSYPCKVVPKPFTAGYYNYNEAFLDITWQQVSRFKAAFRSAQFVSQTPPPATMQPGQTATVSVTMKNTGSTIWSPYGANPYRLGSQNPQDNTVWGLSRASLTASVAPGQTYTFTFAITAPVTAGTYNFQWRMVQEWVEWFGDYSPDVQTVFVQDFSVSSNCSYVSLAPGGYQQTCTITVKSLAGFSGTVTLSSSISPVVGGGPTTSLSPTSVALAANGQSSSTLTITSGSAKGQFTITVTGVSGSLSHSTTISLTIEVPPPPPPPPPPCCNPTYCCM